MAEPGGPTPSRQAGAAALLHEPLAAELLNARLVASLATFNEDGTIHLVPMWFAPAGETIVLATGSRSRKVRNLERDPRATLMLHDSWPGFEVCGMSLAGNAEVVRPPAASPLERLVHARYVDESGEQPDRVHRFLEAGDVALRFRPLSGLWWDERGSPAARALAESGAFHSLEPTSPRVSSR